MVATLKYIAFRVDSSRFMGTGHVMRCLTLALAFKNYGANCHFICREHLGHVAELFKQHGFMLHMLPHNDEFKGEGYAQWLGETPLADYMQTVAVLDSIGGRIDMLVVDHYAIDAEWEGAISGSCQRLMVIDDLANRAHCCDVLLDQTFNRKCKAYQSLVSEKTTLLLGSDYALLRDEFSLLREKSVARRKKVTSIKRLLLSLGGSDPDNLTLHLLQLLMKFERRFTIDVVMGGQSPRLNEVANFCVNKDNISLHVDSEQMASLMSEADIAIGAAGMTSFERACLGLPCLLVVLADNQRMAASALDEAGAVISLGNTEQVLKRGFLSELLLLINDKERYQAMVKASFLLCDGQGLSRVLSQLNSI